MRLYLAALLLCLTAIVAGRGLLAFLAIAVLTVVTGAAGVREWKQDVRERRLARLRERRGAL